MVPSSSDGLTLEQLRSIHDACERFEAAFRAGGTPRIEDLLPTVPAPTRDALLHELVALEAELRLQRGENPTIDEYRDRFPDHPAVISTAFPTAPNSQADETILLRPHVPAASRRLPEIGQRVGEYQVLDELAHGGMGVVYKARHVGLNRLVALKMIRGGMFATEAEFQRFQLEAEAAAALDHPNIVPIYEIGRHFGQPYYTMKLVEGGTLADHAPRLRQSPRALARTMATIARALDYAHKRRFVHRDLKPANVLIDAQGEPIVTDFGLAKRTSDDSELTQPGALIGTPRYMAPEQAAGRSWEVSPRSDIFACGAVLYEVLAGRPAFDADCAMDIVLQVIEREPEPPSRFQPQVPADLERICARCLEKRAEDRYQTAQELADDLDRFIRGEPIEARRPTLIGRARRWARRHPALASRLVGLGVVFLCTQFNFVSPFDPGLPPRNWARHGAISTVLVLWVLAALACARLGRRPGWLHQARQFWVLSDFLLLTLGLWALDAGATSLVVGYPLLIVAAGLWFRVSLVALATLLALVGYVWVAYSAPTSAPQHPNIVVAALAVTGAVVRYQVQRVCALSNFYEQRLPAD